MGVGGPFDVSVFNDPVPARAASPFQAAPTTPFQRVVGCQACPIRQEARRVVPAIGPKDAPLLFFGQGPGEEEDLTGLPFVGESGKELNRWLKILGINRAKIAVGNCVRCKTKSNREPLAAEAKFCSDLWLGDELAYWDRLQVIVPLGKVAQKALLGKAKAAASDQVYVARIRIVDRELLVIPLHHPAYLLRAPNVRLIFDRTLARLREHLKRDYLDLYRQVSS